MKKLMLIALLVLGATAFAADENTTTEVEAKDVPAAMSLGESFMAAFGMGDLNEKSIEDVEAVDTTAALNVATTISNNSVTIVTPYGKY